MIAAVALFQDYTPTPYDGPSTHEGENERLLLASIIRRAAFDIVLYRNAPRLVDRLIGVSAYHWMFKEESNHFTAFLSICEILDQDPNWIRRQTLKLKKTDVKKYDRIR
jgi:hypothetical protein